MYQYGDFEGIPFLSPIQLKGPPTIKLDEIRRAGKVYIEVLDLSDADALNRYSTLRQKQANGVLELTIDKQWVPETKNWKILAEVIEYYWTFKTEVLESLK